MANHSSILAWEIPWTEETAGPQGRKESGTTESLSTQNTKWDMNTPSLVESE